MSGSNRVLFMGSKQLGLRILQEMHALSSDSLIGVMTIDDRTDTRSIFPQFREFSQKNNIPFFQAGNRKEAEKIIYDARPDLCFVVGWYWLISATALEMVPNGFIGIHNSLLPQYRGGSPLVWQIINNEPIAGFTIFSFTPGMDDGPIWAQGSVNIDATDYVGDILLKLETEIVSVFRTTYPGILKGSVNPIQQEAGKETYCAQRIPEDGEINWDLPAPKIYNFIRAQSEPYPGAFSYLNHKKLTIWRATVFNRTYFGSPGQIARITPEGVIVICGDNTALRLMEIEIDGLRGKATDLIRSVKNRMSNIARIETSHRAHQTNET